MIYIISDIHADVNKNSYKSIELPHDAKDSILVLAGDINTRLQGEQAISLVVEVTTWYAARYKHVVLVLGNHDYYGSEFDNMPNIQDRLPKNAYHLNKSHIEIDEYLFWGDTLWSGLYPQTSISHYILMSGNSDFRNIRKSDYYIFGGKRFNQYISPDDMSNAFIEAIESLYNFSLIKTSKRKIVVTHFSPSNQSIVPEYKNSLFNYYFHNDLDNFIRDRDIDTWIHGHVHSPLDYFIGNTRVMSNPLGYRQFENSGYSPLKAVT